MHDRDRNQHHQVHGHRQRLGVIPVTTLQRGRRLRQRKKTQATSCLEPETLAWTQPELAQLAILRVL